MAVAEAPPVVHALGGSFGSALALLIFYPLERARIELQSQASSSVENDDNYDVDVDLSSSSSSSSSVGSTNVELQSNKSDVVSSTTDDHQEHLTTRVIVINNTNKDDDNANTRQSPSAAEASSSDDSWVPLVEQQQQQSDQMQPTTKTKAIENEEMTPSWSMEITIEEEGEEGSKSSSLGKSNKKKVGLLKCLLRLHKRRELYQGVTPVISTIFWSQFIFFYMNAYIKNLIKTTTLLRRPNQRQTNNNKKIISTVGGDHPIISLISSCLAGIGNVLLTNPLWVVNMAIITGTTKTNSLWNEFWTMIKQRGWKHMWSGTPASILLVSNPVIQFFCYEQFKQSRIKWKTEHMMMKQRHSFSGSGGGNNVVVQQIQLQTLDALEAFAVGAMAKGIATIVTYPLQLTQTVLRLKDNGYKGTIDCLIKLFKRGGFKEWYTGIRAKLLQTVLTSAFMFLTYEQIVGAVQIAWIRAANNNHQNRRPREGVLL